MSEEISKILMLLNLLLLEQYSLFLPDQTPYTIGTFQPSGSYAPCIKLMRVIELEVFFKRTKGSGEPMVLCGITKPCVYTRLNVYQALEASNEVFLNSFNSFSKLKVDLRALVPAALFPFSACEPASVLNASNSLLIFSINSFIMIV